MIESFSGRFRFSSGALEDPDGPYLWEHHCVAASLGPVPPARIIDEYRNRGMSFVEELTDETSFVLWDSGSATLVAARDRFGARPLYFRREPNGWAFATSLRDLRPRRLNVPAVLRHFAGVPSPVATCFEDIEYLSPGTYMVVTDWGTRLRRVPSNPQPSLELHEALELAVRERVPTGRFACALSGGLDSSVILALARGEAYTHLNEIESAKQTASLLGVKHVCLTFEDAELVKALPETVEAAGAPLFNLQAVAKFLMARQVRADGIDVLIGGEGADERIGDIPPLCNDREVEGILAPGLCLPEPGGEKFLDTVFPVSVLQMRHGAAAANGVELRFPYLDRRVQASSEERRGKKALREAARRWLPSGIVDRPKSVFESPPVDFFRSFLDEEKINRLGLFRAGEVLRLRSTSPGLERALTRIVTLCMLVERCVG